MKAILPFITLLFFAACKTLAQDEPEIEKIIEDGTKEIIKDLANEPQKN